jgi:hypothetical protein
VAKLGPNAGSPRLVSLVVGWLQKVFQDDYEQLRNPRQSSQN